MLRALGNSLRIASGTNWRRLGLSSSNRSIRTRCSATVRFQPVRGRSGGGTWNLIADALARTYAPQQIGLLS